MLPGLRETVGALLAASGQPSVVDGRFKGGWITRAHGKPSEGVEAVQMELACRAYMAEPKRPGPGNWPTPIDEARAAPTRATLQRVLEAMLAHVSRRKVGPNEPRHDPHRQYARHPRAPAEPRSAPKAG